MEEEKAAAYYDELTRKGEGAARFKQGLGFSSASSNPFPHKQNSSLLSNFVRASSPSKAAALDKEAQIEKIQNKLKKLPRRSRSRSPSPSDRGRRRRQSGERENRHSDELRRRRSTSRNRRRDGSSSSSRHHRHHSHERDEDLYRSSRRRSRSRSRSPVRDSRSRDPNGKRGRERDTHSERHKSSGSKSSSVDYSKLIKGYSDMTPAERVKAKMKLQLSETAARDTTKGSGWERFDFNKDAPMDNDNDDETEVADDDASLVKNIGKSFRLSAVEAKREEQIKAAHDEAMFGVSIASKVTETGWGEVNDTVDDHRNNEANETQDNHRNNGTDDGTEKPTETLVSDKVIALQQISWRERARKLKNDLKS